jgi:hypothetical protein
MPWIGRTWITLPRARHQLGEPVLMDGPALRKRHGLVTVRLGTEKGSDLIEDEAETRGSGEGFEPARMPVALLDTPMVLLNGLITHDKFHIPSDLVVDQ